MDPLEFLKEKIEKAPVVKVGGYEYFVNPFQGVSEPLAPALIEGVTKELVKRVNVKDVDVIACVEAIGIGIGYSVAVQSRKPVAVVRKKEFPIENKLAVEKVTGYGRGKMFVYGDFKGKRVLVVDDVLSTGGTLVSVINALRKKGAEIVGAIVVMERGHGREKVKEKTGIDVRSLCRVTITNGRPVAKIER